MSLKRCEILERKSSYASCSNHCWLEFLRKSLKFLAEFWKGSSPISPKLSTSNPFRNPSKIPAGFLNQNNKSKNLPSLVRTEESGDYGKMFGQDLYSLGTGRGLSAGSIFQGETLSGRRIVEVSSHLTLKKRLPFQLHHKKQKWDKMKFKDTTFRHLHFDSGHLFGSASSVPTIAPVNLCSGAWASSPSNRILNLIPME